MFNDKLEYLVAEQYLTNESFLKSVLFDCITKGIKSVIVGPNQVEFVRKCHAGSVKIAAAIGCPDGIFTVDSKINEIEQAIENGADDLYIMLNCPYYTDERWNECEEEICRCIEAAGGRRVVLMFEAAILTDIAKRKICESALKYKADGLMLSAGFIYNTTFVQPENGALIATYHHTTDVADITFIKGIVKDNIGIIAAADCMTREEAEKFITVGADKIATFSINALLYES